MSRIEQKEEIIRRIERGRDKVKRIEAKQVSPEFRKESAWLVAINDVIDRTASAIRDELINK